MPAAYPLPGINAAEAILDIRSERRLEPMKLVQKQLLKGTREFEIIGDAVNYRFKAPFKEEKLTIDLRMLNPEPEVNQPFLEFNSRVKGGHPLLMLLIDKPNAVEFNTFVDELRQRARRAYNDFAGLRAGAMPGGLAANVYEEPPEFDEPVRNRSRKTSKPVRVADIDTSIEMLRQHLQDDDIAPLLDALEALKSNPEDESSFALLVEAFDDLGPRQGAVLTYAPYVSLLLSDDPFGY